MIWTETDAAKKNSAASGKQEFAAYCRLPAVYRPSGSVREAFFI